MKAGVRTLLLRLFFQRVNRMSGMSTHMEEWDESSRGVGGRRCSWIAPIKAETSGRLLEKLEPVAVEKKRRFGSFGGRWDASG